ncbi:hypothetical protein T265_06593 [Opisthorchis viverrini]|uniref:Uncharacterized protein n=1 Tax=Opisthorchis viverrini TaxID=6198 RepID=A0A074ZFY3_OPIVI|nr:hypothetical protein T265_06593 [Opisthorchis viverrini]KER26113.1 hypothetical protein T265_06593 [Opisthorchis viverrini]
MVLSTKHSLPIQTTKGNGGSQTPFSMEIHATSPTSMETTPEKSQSTSFTDTQNESSTVRSTQDTSSSRTIPMDTGPQTSLNMETNATRPAHTTRIDEPMHITMETNLQKSSSTESHTDISKVSGAQESFSTQNATPYIRSQDPHSKRFSAASANKNILILKT